MGWPQLDTHGWNLSLGALASTVLAACGPTIILDQETDSVTDTDTDTDTNVDPTTTVECNNGSDCEPGFECIDNVCVQQYDYYCQDGGCCYDGCCYHGCHYYDCYSDQDCGQGLCSYGGCEYPESLPSCDGLELSPQELPTTGEAFVSLSFVDANGDGLDDLVVGREGATTLHLGPGMQPSVALPVPNDAVVIDAVAGDFNDDGEADLVVSTADGRLLVLAADGAGGFALVWDQPVGGALRELVALQWNGDGALDVAGVTPSGQAVLQLGNGAGAFVANAMLPSDSAVTSMTKTRFSLDAYDDLLVQDDVAGQLFNGSFSGDLDLDASLPGELHGLRRVRSGDLDGAGPHDVVGVTSMPGWVLLEVWRDAQLGPHRLALPGTGSEGDGMVGMGDVDGDGVPDVVMASGETLTIAHGSPGHSALVSCVSSYAIGVPLGALAVGDFDGDGRADVAFESGGIVSVLRAL